jgi:hypothetical protein
MKFGFKRDGEFARELADRLAKELSPVLMDTRRKVLSVNKVTRSLEKAYESAAAYQAEHRLGFIRRAFIANDFRWALKEAGYPQDFIDVAVEGLVVELSKKKPAAKAGPGGA